MAKATNNLTSDDLKTWMNTVNDKINNQISHRVLQNIADNVQVLSEIASSDGSGVDEDDLCYRLEDLATLVRTAQEKLSECMNKWQTELDEAIAEREAKEGAAAEKARQARDNFAESAEEIKNIQ